MRISRNLLYFLAWISAAALVGHAAAQEPTKQPADQPRADARVEVAKNVRAKAAMAVEHCFSGQGLGETWDDGHRRGAFVGGFSCYSK